MLNRKEKRTKDQELYNKYIERHPEMKDFFNMMLEFEPHKDNNITGAICVKAGKKTAKGFQVYLSSCTNNPMVMLDSWNGKSQVYIRNDDDNIYHSDCLINLDLIKDFVCKRIDTISYSNRYQAVFNYGNVDYQIEIYID